MAEPTRQHYQLATGKGKQPAPGGKPSSPQPMKKGGKAKKRGGC